MQHDAPLAPRTTFQIGGRARRLFEATTESELIEAVSGEAGPCFLLGGGSNVLVSDEGFDGLVVAVRTRGISLREQGGRVLVTAAAGEGWDGLVERACGEGLAGLECLSGIPGLVGATPIQNVGAYGQEVSDTITRVRAYDREEKRVVEIAPSDCAFAYRDSAFKSRFPDRFVVLEVTFGLERRAPRRPAYAELSAALEGEQALTAARVREVVIGLRRKKAMVLDEADPDSRSAGSFFTNPQLDDQALARLKARAREQLGEGASPPVFAAGAGNWKVAAAWLIERAGFPRGTARGKAAISSKHALALTNRGGATAAEIVALAREIQHGVFERFGVRLTPEPVLVGFASYPL